LPINATNIILFMYTYQLHPGTKTYVIDRFCGLASLEPLWHQTKKLADDLLKICSLHPEGVHVIGKYKCIYKLVYINILQYCCKMYTFMLKFPRIFTRRTHSKRYDRRVWH